MENLFEKIGLTAWMVSVACLVFGAALGTLGYGESPAFYALGALLLVGAVVFTICLVVCFSIQIWSKK